MSIKWMKEYEFKKGERHVYWKGGRIKQNGYVYIYAPNHPFAIGKGSAKYISEHRLVMEKKIGRYLSKDEIVHHKNGIKNDNKIQNLELLNSSEHTAIHNHKRKWKAKSKEKHSIKASKMIRDKKGKFVRLISEKAIKNFFKLT